MTTDDLVNKIDALTAGLKWAVRVLDNVGALHTAHYLQGLLDGLESSGMPGQLSDRVVARHDVNWGACPECGCFTDLAFRGWPHGPSQDVQCANCGWSGVFVDSLNDKLETPHESG